MSDISAHVIAAAMGEVLDTAEVAPEDHFFDAGGTSIMAVHLVATLRGRGVTDASLLDVLREPTPVGLARRLNDRAHEQNDHQNQEHDPAQVKPRPAG